MEETRSQGNDSLADSFASRFSLRHPAIRATAWHFGGYVYSQGLRFGSNLILARLLVPEDFGLMLIVNLVLHGLEMFSDLGMGLALIHHPRGEEPSFLRTAWTFSLIRGTALWAAAGILAWPLAEIYGEPRLTMILPVAGASLLLDAACSTYVVVMERRLDFARITIIGLVSYTVSVAVMIAGALFTSTVWPLVAGTLVYAGLSSLLTHYLPNAIPMRLQVDREVARVLFTFGRWLTLSSMLTFAASQLDRILLGKLMTITELGVYSIAFMMAQVTISLMSELVNHILYPVYARAGEMSEKHFRSQVRRYRLFTLLLTAPPLLLLYLIGPELMHVLYDERYRDAGWMLQILSAGALLTVLLAPAESVLIARGDSFRHMLLQGISVIAIAASLWIGFILGGTAGMLIGFALSPLARYPFTAAFTQRHGAWLPGFDLSAVVVLCTLGGLGMAIRTYLHLQAF